MRKPAPVLADQWWVSSENSNMHGFECLPSIHVTVYFPTAHNCVLFLQSSRVICQSGCYCPEGQYEDHTGACVNLDNCTCVYGGAVFRTGQSVDSDCRTWFVSKTIFLPQTHFPTCSSTSILQQKTFDFWWGDVDIKTFCSCSSPSVCSQGQWTCVEKPCMKQCQVYGNGHYQTFDSRWYRFHGNCQYTLVEVRIE